MVKGAALFLQQGNSPQGQRSLQHPHKHAGKFMFLHWNLFSVQLEESSITGGELFVGFQVQRNSKTRFVMMFRSKLYS